MKLAIMKRLFIAFALASCAGIVVAEEVPAAGSLDPRVRVVPYNAAEVIRLNTYYGVSTHVQFAEGEKVTAIAAGDDKAWQIVHRNNHLFIKPKEENADTNVTVVTDKRVYQFALVVQPHKARDTKAWSDPNLIFSLSFRYPEDDAKKRQVKVEADQAKAAEADMKGRLAAAKSMVTNTNYWVAGSREISPTSARDDGRFMYLTFSNNRDMPRVFAVDATGAESLVKTSVDGNTIIVERMLREVILRKGSAVARVVNKSFDLDAGTDNTSGTVAPTVQRVIKEVQ